MEDWDIECKVAISEIFLSKLTLLFSSVLLFKKKKAEMKLEGLLGHLEQMRECERTDIVQIFHFASIFISGMYSIGNNYTAAGEREVCERS